MDRECNQDGQYSDYDDTGTYTDDYDDEVFATLNRESLPRFIPYRDNLCLTKEQAEHVYEVVANGKQVNPLAVNSRVDELSEVVNPYIVGLRTDTDSTLKKEPSSEIRKCNLTWSILSTAVDYTEHDKDSPYKEVNHSLIYSRFESAQDLMIDEQSGLWDERFEEVSCNLYMVSPHYCFSNMDSGCCVCCCFSCGCNAFLGNAV